MPAFNPRRILGAWADGYVLDIHSTGSTLIGHNEFGHPMFDTHRTEIGQLLYQAKYQGDEAALLSLADVADEFIRSWQIDISAIVPIPSTRAHRKLQPVIQLAEQLSLRFQLPLLRNAIRRDKQFGELKNVFDREKRRELLENAFTVVPSVVSGYRILLVDDLYRSGATMGAITEVLLASGAAAVYAFALTQTRSRA